MMNEMRIFQNKAFGAVRVVEHNGAPWFVGNDVAKALGYERPNDAVNAHCKKINKFSYGNSPQGAMPYNIIPESDVYRLVMRSNLPARWSFRIGFARRSSRLFAGAAITACFPSLPLFPTLPTPWRPPVRGLTNAKPRSWHRRRLPPPLPNATTP